MESHYNQEGSYKSSNQRTYYYRSHRSNTNGYYRPKNSNASHQPKPHYYSHTQHSDEHNHDYNLYHNYYPHRQDETHNDHSSLNPHPSTHDHTQPKSPKDESKTNKPHIIATFDTKHLLQRKRKLLKPKIESKHILYYHTNPTNKLLEFKEDAIKPKEIDSEIIKSLTNLNLNDIPIDYSSVKKKAAIRKRSTTKQQLCYSLSQKQTPYYCRGTTRIDPFCREIQIIDKAINNNNDIDPNKAPKTPIRFITYRHNIRAIAHIVLFKLIKMKIYDKCGINIGVHRKGNDIILENITEYDEKTDKSWNVNCAYGYLLEHTLEILETTDHDNAKDIDAMDYQKVCLNRDEIRKLNEIQIGDDVRVLFAAEMDFIMNAMNDSVEVIELKSCKIQSEYWRNRSRLGDIANFKLLKYWTQCFFGGVDSVVIAFHEKGVIQRTRTMKTQEIEAMFPVITKKCIIMVHEVLKWLKTVVMELPENNLYILGFDTNNQNNTEFVLRHLSSKQAEKKIFQMLCDETEREKDKRLNHGLIINPKTKQIELRQIL